MAFDYKKEYKEFYMPSREPGIVTVPSMNYMTVRGQGDPNAREGEYKQSIGLLYGIAFTVKMSQKAIIGSKDISIMSCHRLKASGGRMAQQVSTMRVKETSSGFQQSAFRIL